MPDKKLTDVPENNVEKTSDNEIVNDVEQVTMALEYCVECDCEKCPYDELTACNEYLKLDAVKVINRLQAENENYSKNNQTMTSDILKLYKELEQAKAEIERLKSDVSVSKDAYMSMKDRYEYEKEKVEKAKQKCIDIGKALKNAKAEAYKECIEKIKALFPSDNEPYQYWEIHEGSDNLLKELVGENNA